MIALIGLIMFIVSSYLALSKKMHLMVPFIVVPVIAALFCGFSFTDDHGLRGGRRKRRIQHGAAVCVCGTVLQRPVRDRYV